MEPAWFWPASGISEGPARIVVVDIDGVLADARHRQHLLSGQWSDWDEFFSEAGGDGLLAQQAHLLELLDPELLVVLLTARPAWISGITLRWLEQHEVRWDLLIMRPQYDFGPSARMKSTAIKRLRERGFDPTLAFDDDPRNVAAFAGLGVPCVYVHSGYHGGVPAD